MNQPRRRASSAWAFRYVLGIAFIVAGAVLLLQFPTGSLLGMVLILLGVFCFG